MKIIWCNGSHKIKQMNSSAWAPLKIKKPVEIGKLQIRTWGCTPCWVQVSVTTVSFQPAPKLGYWNWSVYTQNLLQVKLRMMRASISTAVVNWDEEKFRLANLCSFSSQQARGRWIQMKEVYMMTATGNLRTRGAQPLKHSSSRVPDLQFQPSSTKSKRRRRLEIGTEKLKTEHGIKPLTVLG